MKKRKKYAFGTNSSGVTQNFLQTPGEALALNSQDKAQASYDAMTNPWTMGLNALGAFTIANAGSMAQGLNGGAEAAFGGQVQEQNGIPVEVEGGETIETPNGTVGQFQGPSHAQGGIPTALPQGTEIYSKRVKIDGVSLADRKGRRKKRQLTLENLLKANDTDQLIKNSLKRMSTVNKKEEDADMKLQTFIGNQLNPQQQPQAQSPEQQQQLMQMMQQNQMQGQMQVPQNQGVQPEQAGQQFALGTLFTRSKAQKGQKLDQIPGTEEEEKSFLGGVFNNPGDVIGMVGNAVSGIAPLIVNAKSRASDIPNVNTFQKYGQQGLDTMAQNNDLLNSSYLSQINSLNSAQASQRVASRGSSRGVNNQRAMDLAASAQGNIARTGITNSYLQSKGQLNSSLAQMQNQVDQIRMGGEAARNQANQEDIANYYSNLMMAYNALGQGTQQTGKDINQAQNTRISQALINQLSDWGIIIGKDGIARKKGNKNE